MPRRLSFLAVEGQHDVAFVGRFLSVAGFQSVTDVALLDQEFQVLVPKTFPFQGNLRRRMPVPAFHQTAQHTVAIHATEGESNLANETANALLVLAQSVEAVGFVLDADKARTPAQRFTDLIGEVTAKVTHLKLTLTLPPHPGDVIVGPPRSGVFIMPDNMSSGTLEDILLDCAGSNYSDLKALAAAYLASIPQARKAAADFKEFRKPAGSNKAHVAAIGTLLRPGKAIQVSIQDNDWVDAVTMALPRVSAFRLFLRSLLNEPGI